MTLRTSMKPDRRYTGTSGQEHQRQIEEQRLSSSSTPFRRAIVTEIFNDPINQTAPTDTRDPDITERLPRGAILARIITGGSDNLDSRSHVFLPLFGPYLNVPIKVGEHVLVMYDDPTTTANIGFWITRIPELRDVDDVNYTHGDRRFETQIIESDIIDKIDGTQTNVVPNFINGHESGDAPTIGVDANEYNHIVNTSRAGLEFQYEAVPRFANKVGDFMMQGSNNTLLCLTTNILSGSTDNGSGAVVISCGRGQTDITRPVTVTNTREYSEVDKTPEMRGSTDNLTEGQIDCVNDLSTFVMSMKTNVDKLFDIDIQNSGELTNNDSPAAAIKSTHIRFIAREDIILQAGENNIGASIILKASGDILLIPGPNGLIKLGGDDAAVALLGNDGAQSTPGQIVGRPIISTMGGVVGPPGSTPHGKFATKIVTS